jgi:lipoprotein-releasing system permease protein
MIDSVRLPFSIYLALKYFKPKRTFLSVVTVISVLGVILGVAVMVIVLSVMTGFDDMWREKILAFNAHVSIQTYGVLDDELEVLAAMEQIDGVVGAAPYIEDAGYLRIGGQGSPVIVRGVDPVREEDISQVPQAIKEGEFLIDYDHAVIGRDLALKFGIMVGDTILLYSPQMLFGAEEGIAYLPQEVTIAGIFELGMWDFDASYVWIHIDVARDLFQVGEGVHGIQAMTRDPLKIEPVLNAIMESVGEGMIVRSWKEQNRTLFATLEVEKNIIFLIVLCIAVVAAFSICNTLITVVVQKTREIGLLKAVGFAPGHILRVFLCMGWVLGITGTVFGFGLGLTVLRFRNDLLGLLNRKLDFELLPSEYYHLTEIPSTTTVEDSLLVVVCVMVVCTVAALVPAYRAARLDPASALRYE